MWGCFFAVVIGLFFAALPVLLLSPNGSKRSSNPAEDRDSTP